MNGKFWFQAVYLEFSFWKYRNKLYHWKSYNLTRRISQSSAQTKCNLSGCSFFNQTHCKRDCIWRPHPSLRSICKFFLKKFDNIVIAPVLQPHENPRATTALIYCDFVQSTVSLTNYLNSSICISSKAEASRFVHLTFKAFPWNIYLITLSIYIIIFSCE